ncbi:dolichyl-phosphate-mannose-protein mannosyltransferase [Prochlorococcus marinus str. MIT 9312]|uniref:Dolichyl-phosphate-mannose-protein mannosyltransferase n=1 Tax=Prochlorococcus marinus (strain MIT 9312) TaxID=74546 RepID=Q319S5_PROM9|nr:glycosyltransferase family 39 protein [Prochlorococcus marinus]ABB50370.1 dolichyl-phosphate-mannose-protein mannosyltransferase [Prochlorococcus marinus str. MIT 9312]KGF99964.1 Dolichyl-phosphate-mannose-protein mannosyltransferase [Prochlorococcus marinus str. MIT 9311]
MNIENTKSKLKYLLFLPLLIYFGKRSLIAYDEGFYALQARWIIEKSNWIGPMWWDEVTSDRTIGIQFLIAISKKLFGDSIFVIYIPIIFAAILMIYCTYQLHKELIKDKNPIYSAFILSTTFLWINYAHMATQDIVFSSLVSLGLVSTIKAYKTNNKNQILISGSWIGLAFMMKTYLTAIPLLGLFPFLIRSKLIYKRNFWVGTILGFMPFLLWSYKYILLYSFSTYSGLFEKLIFLSKNNHFTNPFYYYLWNLSINIFPWTIPSFVGLFKASRVNIISRYFLFYYPIFILVLLSLFSTKTPYYPIQILSLISINTYIGIKCFIENNNKNIIFYLEKINFLIIPILTIAFILIINFSEIISLDNRTKPFIFIGAGLFSLIWITYNLLKNKKRKLNFAIIGPYLLILFLVQSGLITDKSKELRIAIENLVKNENLSNISIEIIKPEFNDDEVLSKIIKIMVKTPKIGKRRLDNLSVLSGDSYAWTTKDFNKNIKLKKYQIVNEDKVFYPWKLIYKK